MARLTNAAFRFLKASAAVVCLFAFLLAATPCAMAAPQHSVVAGMSGMDCAQCCQHNVSVGSMGCARHSQPGEQVAETAPSASAKDVCCELCPVNVAVALLTPAVTTLVPPPLLLRPNLRI